MTYSIIEITVFDLKIGHFHVKFSFLVKSKCAERNISSNIILCVATSSAKNQYISISRVQILGFSFCFASVVNYVFVDDKTSAYHIFFQFSHLPEPPGGVYDTSKY